MIETNGVRDLELMKLAVELSRQSKAEHDGRVHPFVGAVIVNQNGVIISSGYRGKTTLGNHAEQEAMVGIADDVLKGAVVYTTLEPCTYRGKQTPCCLRLIDKGISEVVIGILDPNRDIRGRGWWKFMEHKIKLRTFAQNFVEEIYHLKRWGTKLGSAFEWTLNRRGSRGLRG
jgi:pyrimidine deaminase RibD-like protein